MSAKTNSSAPPSYKPQDYRCYRLSKKEKLREFAIGTAISFIALYLFYNSLFVIPLCIFCGIYYCRRSAGKYQKNKLAELETGFVQWLSSVASNLQAGHSVENAFLKGEKELSLIYPHESDIRSEIRLLAYRLDNNITLENALFDFGQRSGSKDIKGFVDVFISGKRSGGDIRSMIENCCDVIHMRNEVEGEIKTMIHGKAMEQKIMCVVPFAIILYISLTSPGYFDPLYKTLAGRIIMTIILVIYLASVWLSKKITDIRV